MAAILIIEDDPKQLRLYAKALRGHVLTCFTTGSEALRVLLEPFDAEQLFAHRDATEPWGRGSRRPTSEDAANE